MLIVFGALKIELITMLKMIHIHNINRNGKTIIYEGLRDNGPVTIIQTGMGTENTKRATQLFMDKHLEYIKDCSTEPGDPVEVLMIGFCGAADRSLRVGDTVVYNSIKNITCSNKMGFSLNGSLKLEKDRPIYYHIKDGPLYVIGTTVPEVITDPAVKKKLNTDFDIQTIDIESYPVAETMLGMNLPFSCIRVVSDGARDLLPSYLGSTPGLKMAATIILSLLRSIFDRKELMANINAFKNIKKANLKLAEVSANLISGYSSQYIR